MASKVAAINQLQNQLAQELYTGAGYVRKLKEYYDRLLGINCTRHYTYDSTFYICDDGALGFRAIKFYNDSTDYRIGAYQPGAAEAYTDALVFM